MGVDYRPVENYREDGNKAFWAGDVEATCPHAEGTMAHADWTLGFREVALEVAVEMHGDHLLGEGADEVAYCDADFRFARSNRWRVIRLASEGLPSIEACEAAVGIPAREWAAKCFGVATAIVGAGLLRDLESIHGKAEARYGLFDGEVSEGSLFFGKPIVRHG
jgi:hypothetical protein